MAPSCSRCLNTNIKNLECENNCKFCHSCIERFIYADYKNGKLEFICPNAGCKANITLKSLTDVLKDDWKNVVYRRRLLQLNASGHQNLEFCPCCDCVAVLDCKKEHISCLNPKCLKDICVKCKGDAHSGMHCKEMGNIRIGLCNNCGNKFFDNSKCVEEATTVIDDEQIMKVVRNSWENYRQEKPTTSYFGNVVDYCNHVIYEHGETLIISGISTIGTYFLMKYLLEKL